MNLTISELILMIKLLANQLDYLSKINSSEDQVKSVEDLLRKVSTELSKSR